MSTIELNPPRGSMQILTCLGSKSVINFSGTSRWRRHPCQLLIQRLNSSPRKPPSYPWTKGTFVVPTLCHSQRDWTFLGEPSSVITLARKTRALEQILHHTPMQGRIQSEALFLRSWALWALPIWKAVIGTPSDMHPKRVKPSWLSSLERYVNETCFWNTDYYSFLIRFL